jgi:hypothetical protein
MPGIAFTWELFLRCTQRFQIEKFFDGKNQLLLKPSDIKLQKLG